MMTDWYVDLVTADVLGYVLLLLLVMAVLDFEESRSTSFNVDVLLKIWVSVEGVVLHEGNPVRQDVLGNGDQDGLQEQLVVCMMSSDVLPLL